MRDSCSNLILQKLLIKSVALIVVVGILSVVYDCSYVNYKMGEMVKNGADPILVKFLYQGVGTTGDQALYTIRAAMLEGRDGLSSIHEEERQRGIIHSTSGRGGESISYLPEKEPE